MTISSPEGATVIPVRTAAPSGLLFLCGYANLGLSPIWLHTSSCCPRPLVLPGQGRNLGCAGGRSRSRWALEAHRRCAPDILPDKPPRPAFRGDGEAASAVAASC